MCVYFAFALTLSYDAHLKISKDGKRKTVNREENWNSYSANIASSVEEIEW